MRCDETQAALVREAFALKKNTVNLKDFTPVHMQSDENKVDSTFLVDYDREELDDNRYYATVLFGDWNLGYPVKYFSSEKSSLEEAINDIDYQINKYKEYFDGISPISIGEVLSLPELSILHFKYDKTAISLKFGEFLVYPKLDVETSMFEIEHLKCEDPTNFARDLKSSRIFYPEEETLGHKKHAVYDSVENMVKKMIILWDNKKYDYSDWNLTGGNNGLYYIDNIGNFCLKKDNFILDEEKMIQSFEKCLEDLKPILEIVLKLKNEIIP